MARGSIIELVDRDEALRMDAGLVRMARGEHAIRLSVGDGLAALSLGWQELGFSTFELYVRERCSRSGRWGQETRALARRLAGLPKIRRALTTGAIGWSMAEVLARFANAEDEEELLDATRGRTVRAVKRTLRDRGAPHEREPEELRYATLDLTLPHEDAWLAEASRAMIESMEGRGEPGSWLEALLAEGHGWFIALAGPEGEPLPADVAAHWEAWRASIAAGERHREALEARAEPGLPPLPPPEVPLSPIEGLPLGPHAIDSAIFHELAPRLASCDVRFGQLLSRFFAARAWRVLGFASEHQYAVERLGMSRSSVYSRIALARRALGLPEIADALHEGSIGYEAATLVARVATPDTASAWVERAKVRTFKHLREEVKAVEMLGRMMRTDDPPGPPSDVEVELVCSLERDFVSGAFARRALGAEREDDAREPIGEPSEEASAPYVAMVQAARATEEALRAAAARERSEVIQTSGDSEDEADAAACPVDASSDATVQMSVPAGREPWRARGKVRLSVRVREDVALHYRQLEAAFLRSGLPGTFMQFLALGFWLSWAPLLGRTNEWEQMLRRYRYTCTSPVCDRPTGPGPHHIVFRAHGGGDEETNLTPPCYEDHIHGIHAGRLRVAGKAPELVWRIGRTPIMEVRGRERRLLV